MKKNILLLALLVGYMVPAYSQLNGHRKMEPIPEQFQNRMNSDFANKHKFNDNFSRSWNAWVPGLKTPLSMTGESDSMKKHSQYHMPCFHPKSGDAMPCYKPTGEFHMRVFKPENVSWGILW